MHAVVGELKQELDDAMWDMVGPLSSLRKHDADKDWVTISANGKCNRDVKVPEQAASVMRIRVQEWLNHDLADYSAFSMCHLIGGNCAPGFVGGSHNEPADCPWGTVVDEMTGKHACCYTVLADGVTVMDLMEIINAYIDGEGNAPRRHGTFRKWAGAMLNFYRSQLHEAWRGGVDNGAGS